MVNKLKIHLAKLESDLSSGRWSSEVVMRLLMVVSLLFFFQQLVEFYILLDVGKSYTDLCAWDCLRYSLIMDHGYGFLDVVDENQGNLAFFPLLPIVASMFKKIFSSSNAVALIAVNKVFFFVTIFAFILFCKKYLPDATLVVTGAVVTFNPYAIYANAGYTETLFLFLTCVCFYFLHQKKYFYLGAWGFFLSAIKVVGIVMLASYIVTVFKMFWRDKLQQKIKMIVAGVMLSSGLLSFMIFLHFHTGDALAFVHASKAWGRVISSPILNVIQGFRESTFTLLASTMSLVALLSCVYLFVKKRYDLAIFSFFCTMIPLSTGLMLSMPRYIWFQAPILLLCAKLVQIKVFGWMVFFCFVEVMIFMYYSWLSGLVFVV